MDNSNSVIKTESKKKPRIITVMSGKGGVGKTTIASNLAIALGALGHRVTLIDLDISMPNVDIHLGLKGTPVGLIDFLEGTFSLDKVTYIGPEGVGIIPSGIVMGGFSPENVKKIKNMLDGIKLDMYFGVMDYVICDMPPGVEGLKIIDKGFNVLLVANPEVTSVADALNMRELLKDTGAEVLGVVLNRVENISDELTKQRVEETLEVPVLVEIPEDKNVKDALKKEIPVVEYDSASPASKEVIDLASMVSGMKDSAKKGKKEGRTKHVEDDRQQDENKKEELPKGNSIIDKIKTWFFSILNLNK